MDYFKGLTLETVLVVPERGINLRFTCGNFFIYYRGTDNYVTSLYGHDPKTLLYHDRYEILDDINNYLKEQNV